MEDVNIWAYVILFAVLCVTHLVQGITGFGSIVLALPVLSFFFPLTTLIPALIAVNLLQSAWFAIYERRHIDRAHAKSLILLSLAGLPFGYAVYKVLPAENLKLVLGGFVVAIAVWNLAGVRAEIKVPRQLYHALNFLGGFSHAALASGGPLLVIYAARMLKDKSAFRATLMLVWTILNLILCGAYTANRAWREDMLPIMGLAIPCIVIGTVLGHLLHDRIPDKPFRIAIFLILLFSGLVLLRPLAGLIQAW